MGSEERYLVLRRHSDPLSWMMPRLVGLMHVGQAAFIGGVSLGLGRHRGSMLGRIACLTGTLPDEWRPHLYPSDVDPSAFLRPHHAELR